MGSTASSLAASVASAAGGAGAAPLGGGMGGAEAGADAALSGPPVPVATALSGRGAALAPGHSPLDLGGLMVEPDLWELTEAEAAHVSELRVSREGVGSVTFHGETDCRELKRSLREVVVLNPGEVVVYPNQKMKPPVGTGLNKPATIVLYGCLPKTQGFRDRKARDRYKKRVKQMTEDKGAEFLDYDCDQGIWHFRVGHF